MEGVSLTHLYFADALCGAEKPTLKVETCGSTGMSLAHAGYYWVSSGMADIVMVVGMEKMFEGDGQATMSSAFDPFFQRTFAAGAPGTFTLQVMEWMNRFNIDEQKARDAAALVSVSNRENAMDNPYAHIRTRVTVEDVKNSKIISYPVRLLDVCPQSDGACAVIFASEEKAKKICKKPAWVKAVSYIGESYFAGECDVAVWPSATEAARRAYSQAGISDPLKEIDLAEIYNPFTYQEMLFYECFGFCPRGEAPDYVLKGTFTRKGQLPCGMSGGTLCANAIGAAGLARVAEGALQICGKAGARQIDQAKLALTHAMGGVNQFNGFMLLADKL
jgi:acetyl-CoA C-acetyltransferase